MRWMTPHVGFCLERDPLHGHAPGGWRYWSLRIGLGRLGEPNRWYKLLVGVDAAIWPSFIWWRTVLGEERGRCVYQDRIVGVHACPWCRFFKVFA